jgi:hypothetical protein
MAKTFPEGEDAFYVKQDLITTKVGRNLAKFGVDAEWFQKTVVSKKVVYVAKYMLCKDPETCTTPARHARDRAREDYQDGLSQLVDLLKALPDVTEDDLDDMGIAYAKGGGNHPGLLPDDFPNVEEDVSVIRRVKFRFGILNSDTHSRPLYAHGTELVGGIFEEEPTHVSQIQRSWFTTRGTLVIEFDEADRGKIFYYCVRWESRSGQKGPWSKILKVRIP